MVTGISQSHVQTVRQVPHNFYSLKYEIVASVQQGRADMDFAQRNKVVSFYKVPG